MISQIMALINHKQLGFIALKVLTQLAPVIMIRLQSMGQTRPLSRGLKIRVISDHIPQIIFVKARPTSP